MSEMDKMPTVSTEYALDRDVEELIGKLVSGTMTAEDKIEYNQLLARRSRMMRPDFGRFKSRRYGMRLTA